MHSKKNIYLPGLNAVRFFAAFLVIIDHTELFKGYLGLRAFWPEEFSSHLGSFGVTIFFTLSGFLITYLLKEEKTVSGDIHIRNFYIRRILRIWPLYYLIALLSFFVLPYFGILDMPEYSAGSQIHQNFWERLLLFIFLLPNVAFVYMPTVPFGNVLWSVGVEEQFYLFWPWLVKKIRKNIIYIALGALIVYMIIKWIFILNVLGMRNNNIITLIDRTRFSCMLIGAMAAGLTNWQFLKSKWLQWVCLLALAGMILNLVQVPYYTMIKNEAQAAVVAVLLINISMNPNSIFKLENRVLGYLGKISYGLYVYHSIAVVVALKLLMSFYTGMNYGVWSVMVLGLSVGLTIVISHISYFYFEKKLLNRKEKYSTVISGDQVKEKEEEKSNAELSMEKSTVR